jgi:RND family efflux transporter MFP subunit
MRARHLLAALILFAASLPAVAQTAAVPTEFTVHETSLTDQKSVFATVESPNVVPARTRIGGTIASLAVRQGDTVRAGQVIAVVADQKLLLQVRSLDAQIAGLQSTLAQAHIDLDRAQTLARQGVGPRATVDQTQTAVNVAEANLRSAVEQRASAQQNLDEGQVLAPVDGRVLTVPLTAGSVVLNGDTVATVGEQPFLLRLQIPEEHALTLRAGDAVRVAGDQLGARAASTGTITLVYPRIDAGRVVADARVADLGNYFVGDRVLVWIAAGTRAGYVIPAGFVETRFGLDYVRRQEPSGAVMIPVQRGEPAPNAEIPDGLEILSGLHDRDILVHP